VPKVTFLPAGETFEFESGKLPYKGHGLPESLLDIAMNFGFHLEHACGGNCACTTCHVVVKQGEPNLSEMEDDELDRVEQAADFQVGSRLGCQAVVKADAKGDVVVEIPAWNRNYISEGGTSILGDAIPPPKNARA
jgi:2Fe-2S ferredoxin